jgi:hypothetical protein
VTSPSSATPAEHLLANVQRPHEHAGAAVDEARHQPLVEGVAETILQSARLGLPLAGVAQPVGTGGDIGQGADRGEAARQGVDVAGLVIQRLVLAGDPVVGMRSARLVRCS